MAVRELNVDIIPSVSGRPQSSTHPARGRLTPPPEERQLRLLMGPVSMDGRIGTRRRWVSENGHPGRCGVDCWHGSPEAALICFEGRR